MCMCCVSCCGLRCTVTGADLTTAKRNVPTRGDRAPRDLRNGRGRVRYATRPLSRRLWWPVAGASVISVSRSESRLQNLPWGLALALCRFALAFSARLYFQYQNMYSLL